MLLEVVGLHCTRGYRALFSELAFTLEAGQLLLVEGHNGSGKTTLLKMLAGLREADDGQVLWDKQPIQAWGAEYRQQFVWLGHSNGIKDDLTALENLHMMQALGGEQAGFPCRDAKSCVSTSTVLERMGLAGNGHRFPRHFSAGMKRRLALSRLLLSSARLWILDEPQAALDRAGIQMFESMLSEHLQRGGSAIMTSHHEVGLRGPHIQRLVLAA
ncbi:MAG: cytochrome c biogenesis heme-transporting ATPase CcmA [Gammaproteobacteria bacterium]|nr:cytochrome c biogenesis heme-transporting ATPase CcmA [Gammaproteobacteria bacterium]MBU1722537.1 cytochrome c biogenesis heme-transporting ATPase CcmA [Gammaproteobacteria bacterium]MBU2004438.1 cytochrome c biogenesis heme-transporting ATPase CcmA [Gammaproteobacteria bacterium]